MYEYKWKTIYKEWGRRLGPRFLQKDNKGNGDCLFHCVCDALKTKSLSFVRKHLNDSVESVADLNGSHIRTLVANHISEDKESMFYWKTILMHYQIAEEEAQSTGSSTEDEMDEAWCEEASDLTFWEPPTLVQEPGWSAKDIKTIDEFRAVILTGGNTYWGDYITVSILQDVLLINIVLLSEQTTEVYWYGCDFVHPHTMVLYYIDDTHFKLVGFKKKNGNIKAIYPVDKFPSRVHKIMDEDACT